MTLADRIACDWADGAVGPEGHIPHEICHARREESVEIERSGKKVTIDIIDTPGITTEIDYKESLKHDMEKDDTVHRFRGATEDVVETMHWLREDVDGVIYVLDNTKDLISQINTMLIGITESQDLPVLIFTNKINPEGSNIECVANAYPQHEAVELPALERENTDEVYAKIAKCSA